MADILALQQLYSDFATWLADVTEAGDRFKLNSILFNSNLVICYDRHTYDVKQAGCGAYEYVAQGRSASALKETIKNLSTLGENWRHVITIDHNCADRNGFEAFLHNAEDMPVGERLRWASVVHYKCASAYLLAGTDYQFICQLSLNSGSNLSKSPAAVRTLAQTGSCEFLTTDGRDEEFKHPDNFTTNLDDPQWNAAEWRATIARFSQDPYSQAVLLATGDALLLTANSALPTALFGAMAARIILTLQEKEGGLAQALEHLKMLYVTARPAKCGPVENGAQ